MTGPQGMGPLVPGGGVPGVPGGGPGGGGSEEEGGPPLPAGCMAVLREPFNDLTRWTMFGTMNLVAGRNGTAVANADGGSRITFTIPSISRSDVITFGCAIRWTDATAPSFREIARFYCDGETTTGIRLEIQNTGALVVARGTTVVAASVAGLMVANTWYYVEVQVKLGWPVSTGPGYVKARINDGQVINESGVPTLDPSVITPLFDTVRLSSVSSGALHNWDDLYITTGSTCLFQGDNPVLGPCKFVLNEPFDNLAAWTNSGGSIISGGRTGTCVNTPTTGEVIYTVASGNRADTFTIGFAWRRSDTADVNAREIFRFYGDDGATLHTKLFWGGDGQLAILRGTTQIATSDFSAMPSVRNTWYYVEAKVKLHDTAGTAIVRIDGTVVINATGLDTKNGGTGTVYDTLWLSGEAIYSTHQYDDLYLTSGPGCLFQDDHVPGAPCVSVLNEPFDNLSAWAIETGSPTIVDGRNGTAVNGNSGARIRYTIPTSSRSDTITIGFAWRRTDSSGNPKEIFRLLGDNGTVHHSRLTWSTPTGMFSFDRGTSGITSSAAGAMAGTTNTWYYIEVQVKLHDTTGFVKVRVNGVQVINATDLDTKNGGINSVYDTVLLAGEISGAVTEYDDLYITTGAGCSFKGDHPVLSPCVPVLEEAFDHLRNFVTSGSPAIIAGGRNGTGIQLTSSTTEIAAYGIPLEKQSHAITMGFAVNVSSIGATPLPIELRSDSGGTLHLNIVINSFGGVSVIRGAMPGTLVAGTVSGIITVNTWHYIEVKIALNDTNGSVIIRVDGVERANYTGIDTKEAGTKTVFDQIRLCGSGFTTTLIDDMYVTTGAACQFQDDHPIIGPTESMGWNATGTGSTAVIGPFPGVQSGDVVALYLTSNRNGASTAGRPTISRTDPADSNSQWRWKDGHGIDAPTGGYGGRSLPYRHDVWLHTIQGTENGTTTWVATWGSSAEWVYAAASLVQGSDLTSWVRFTSVAGGSGSTIRPDYVCPENPPSADIPDRSRCLRTISSSSTVLSPVVPSHLTKLTEATAIPEWQDFTIYVEGTVYAPTESTVKFPEVGIDTTGGGPIFYTTTNGTTTVIVRTFPVTINLAAGQPNPATAEPIVFAVHFSEPVTGFNSSDIFIKGLSVSTITIVGSGTDYTVTLSNIGGSGTMTVTIPGNSINSDTTGLPNAPSTSTNNSVAFTEGTAVRDAILALSPVGYWKLDETTGTTAIDSSGNGRNGTYSGTYTLNNVAGADGHHTHFGTSGTASKVIVPDNSAFSSVSGAGGLTIFCLVKPNTRTTQECIIDKAVSPTNWEYRLWIDGPESNGMNGFVMGTKWDDVATKISEVSTSNDVITANWQAVAFHMDSSNSVANKLYKNTNVPQVLMTSIGNLSSGMTDTGAPIWIGGSNDTSSVFLRGGLAHVAIFKPALSEAQIGTLMDACIADGWFIGPLTGAFGAQQILDCTGSPNTTGTSYSTSGVRVSFSRNGRVVGIRYQRTATPSVKLTFKAWKDSGQELLGWTTDTQSAEGTFTVLFPTPVDVYATGTYTFAYSSTDFNRIPIGTLSSVTNTTDMTFVEFRHLNNSTHLYPSGAGPGVSFYVEPIYEPEL